MPREKKNPKPVKAQPEIELPEPQTKRTGYWVLLAVGLVLLGATSYLAYGGDMTGWEQRVFTFINGAHLPGVVTHLAKALSNAVWGIMGLLFICLLLPKFRFKAWQYLVAAGAGYSVAFIAEHIVDRARPVLLDSDTIMRASQGGGGFPSSHVAALAAVCLTIWLFVYWPWRIFIVILLVAESWARIFLGVHAPLDTIGAVAAAMVAVAVLHLVPNRIRNFFRLM